MFRCTISKNKIINKKIMTNLNMYTPQFRLATAAQPGLPLWITELDISEVSDPTRLADSYEDILMLYFSDPNIHGVLLWGFSDQHHSKPDAALFEGPDYIVCRKK